MKEKFGKVQPYKLIPGGLTLGKASERFMMIDGSATNIQNPQSMKDLG